MSFFAELKRRNVLRAAVLYVGAVWALAQGISQLSPALDLPEWATRWFLLAAAIGFPFAMAFSWFYEWTAHGLVRESEVTPGESTTRQTGRKLDRAIIGVLMVAVALLASGYFVHRDAPAASAPESVAVLPFSNDSGDAGQQYFSDGLSEDLINSLSQFQGLKVISRNSAFQFRNSTDSSAVIGRKLGVAHLLEGSVQRLGEKVRINATLVNAADGSVVWSQQYDRPYADLFALQDEITQSVSAALQTRLLARYAAAQSERPPGGNLQAWQAYQQGKLLDARVTQADARKAIAAYADATRIDPHYAAAYAQESVTWSWLSGTYLAGEAQQRGYAQARAAADKALALAPDLALAHVARGRQLLFADFDWTGAQAEYERAAKLAPNDAAVLIDLSLVYAALGHVQSAAAATRKALLADPYNATGYNWLSRQLAGLGQLDAAQQASAKAIELQPRADWYHERPTVLAILRGDARAALAAAQQEPAPNWQRIELALATQIGVDRTTADAALQTLIDNDRDNAPYQIAEVYALRGDADNTFLWLDRAWNVRDPGIQFLLYDPLILRFRTDPRFAAFCSKVGLPTTTDAVAMK